MRPRSPAAAGRTGASVMEMLVVLLLTVALVALLVGLAVDYARATATLTRRSEVMEARRIVRDLVTVAFEGGGVRAPDPSAELHLRSFVGTAVLCDGEDWWYQGRRLPEPDRDSVWAVSSAGRVEIRAVAGVVSTECSGPGDGRSLRIDLDEPVRSPALLRVFESGRYRIDDAVRYGRSGAGAQPLTAATLDPAHSRLDWEGETAVVRLRGREDSARVLRRWRRK